MSNPDIRHREDTTNGQTVGAFCNQQYVILTTGAQPCRHNDINSKKLVYPVDTSAMAGDKTNAQKH
eukprot:1136625-Amphidinium_carterae.1